MYSMKAIYSSLFQVVCFPFNGKIVMIDQTSFKNTSVIASSGASIPIIDHSQLAPGSVGVGMYPSLMGTFSFPASVLMIGSSFDGDLNIFIEFGVFSHFPYGRSLDYSYTESFEQTYRNEHAVTCSNDCISSKS